MHFYFEENSNAAQIQLFAKVAKSMMDDAFSMYRQRRVSGRKDDGAVTGRSSMKGATNGSVVKTRI